MRKMSRKWKIIWGHSEKPNVGLTAQTLPTDGPTSQAWKKSEVKKKPSPHNSFIKTERMQRRLTLSCLHAKMTYLLVEQWTLFPDKKNSWEFVFFSGFLADSNRWGAIRIRLILQMSYRYKVMLAHVRFGLHTNMHQVANSCIRFSWEDIQGRDRWEKKWQQLASVCPC